MEADEFQYEPLARLMHAIRQDDPPIESEPLKEALKHRGLDSDHVAATIARHISEHRQQDPAPVPAGIRSG